jgi:hypothetical protein
MEVCKNCMKTYKTKRTLAQHMIKCNQKAESKELERLINFELDDYLIFINKKIDRLMKESKYNDDILDDILFTPLHI